jgi:hypothetical protein
MMSSGSWFRQYCRNSSSEAPEFAESVRFNARELLSRSFPEGSALATESFKPDGTNSEALGFNVIFPNPDTVLYMMLYQSLKFL